MVASVEGEGVELGDWTGVVLVGFCPMMEGRGRGGGAQPRVGKPEDEGSDVGGIDMVGGR